MNQSFPFSRATLRVAIFTLAVSALAPASLAQAFTPASKHAASGEGTPLSLSPSNLGTHTTSSGGPSIVRTIVGLLVVIAVIWGLTWILKQVKSGRETRSAGDGLENVATLPLGSGRSLHLVRAGNDHLVVGSAEQGVMPIYRYTEEQAREAGLLASDLEKRMRLEEHPDPGRASIQIPGHGHGALESVLERLREWTVRK
jgi:flagellar protein FliO/FliZ